MIERMSSGQLATSRVTVSRTRALLERPVVMTGGVAGAFVVAGLAASDDDGPVLCVFRRCSGGYCPGCGLTRSAGALIRGDVAGSWARHPYLPLLVGQVVLALGLWQLGSTRVRATLSRSFNAMLFVNTVVLITIWIARLATGTIPVPFG